MSEEKKVIEKVKRIIERYEEIIEHQQKEIEELKNIETYKIAIIDKDKYISKDKIRAKIEELEKEQENNRKSLYNAVNNLCFKEIDKISNKICVNMTVSDILQSLLEEE